MHRKFSSISKAPWAFKATMPINSLKAIDANFKLKIYSNLQEGFTFAYKSLCEALAYHDRAALNECLEPRLAETVCSRLKILEESGHHFKQVSTETPELDLFNFSITLGVEIDRKLNLFKEDYLKIANLESMKSMMPLGLIKEKVEKEGVNFNYDL